MDDASIRDAIKKIVANVTGMDPSEIGDHDSFRDDLDLDSLSLLEIGVDVAYEFKLEIPEAELAGLGDLDEAAALVRQYLSAGEPLAAVG